MGYPDDLKYSDEHEWVRVEGSIGTIGITAYAAEQIGDIVFVELPAVGDTISATESFGVIESVKAVSELFAPVSGTVTEVNEVLADAPESVADDPHGDGWLVKVEMTDPTDLRSLKDAADYEQMVEDL